MKILAGNIKAGNILEINNKYYIVTKNPDHTQPGKGGAYVQVELKDIVSGTKIKERISTSDTVEKVHVEEREMQYLYDEGDKLVLMDSENFEQIEIDASLLGEQRFLLQDGMTITIEEFDDKILKAKLPNNIICEIHECEPVVKGQTATASYKPALIENNLRIMVPPFINVGDKIVVRTEDISYVERAK